MSKTEENKLEKILSQENMQAAWKAVKRNKGAAGVDRKTVDETGAHLKEHWPSIREKLLANTYKPGAVRVVEIPKANGGIRTLGIPNVQDRLIQQAIQQELSRELDSQMSDHSYGFRPGRSAHDAVTAARGYIAAGKTWVVDLDLKNFFDQINHDRLMTQLGQHTRDKRLLGLIGRYLRARLRGADGRQKKRLRGVTQGGPLSPLLANIYLDPLDKELERRGIAFVRYADDVALYLSSEQEAQTLFEELKIWLRKHRDLEINEEKSGVGPSSKSQLLGFQIDEQGNVSVSAKALKKFKTRVKQLWNARQSLTSRELRDQWWSYIRGWWNYFGYANHQRNVKELSGWIRRHIRKCFWQRWHNRAGRQAALGRLGIRGRALKVAGCRNGAWPMARHVVVQQALKTKVLNRYGLTLPWTLAS